VPGNFRRSMKRIIIALALLVPALALALPWYVGKRTETRYRELVAGSGASLSLEDYRRGWFQSTARLRARVELAPLSRRFPALPASLPLTIADHIAHGPLPLAAERFKPALVRGRLRAATPDRDGDTALFTADYALGLDGAVRAALRVPPMETSGWHFGGLDADFEGSGDTSRVDAHASFRGLRRADGSAPLLGPMELVGAARRNSDGLWLGTLGASLDRAGNGDAFSLTELRVGAGADRDGDLAALAATASVKRLRLNGVDYGPGRAQLAVSGLHAEALARLEGSTARLAGAGISPRNLLAALAGTVLADLPELLARNPEIRLQEARLETPEGAVVAAGRVYLADTNETVLNNPFLLRRALRARLELSAPEGAARRLAAAWLDRSGANHVAPGDWLADRVADGRLNLEQNHYVLELHYENGTLTANGRTWNAPDGLE